MSPLNSSIPRRVRKNQIIEYQRLLRNKVPKRPSVFLKDSRTFCKRNEKN